MEQIWALVGKFSSVALKASVLGTVYSNMTPDVIANVNMSISIDHATRVRFGTSFTHPYRRSYTHNRIM
jgi:hypothetical protein